MEVLGDRLVEAKASERLVESPAMVLSSFEQAASWRHRMKVAMMEGETSRYELGMQVLGRVGDGVFVRASEDPRPGGGRLTARGSRSADVL